MYTTSKITIINYGMGNLHSVQRKLKRLGIEAVISSDPNEIGAADKLILPGVGHFKKAMDNLQALHLIDVLNKAVLIRKIPILGICLGMQLMAKYSEEGNVAGLGWVDAEVLRFKVTDTLKYKVPHMGWNQIMHDGQNQLMKDIPNFAEFYFVHSFYLKMAEESLIINESEYENRFCSAFQKDNIFGVQYHPEKSHDLGVQILKNFINL